MAVEQAQAQQTAPAREERPREDRPREDRPPRRYGPPRDRDDRQGGRRGPQRGRRRSPFPATLAEINYKNTDLLSRFLTDRGKIKARRKTGANGKQQRRLSREIKRARHLALLPYTAEYTRGG